jgi:hypothetical protein
MPEPAFVDRVTGARTSSRLLPLVPEPAQPETSAEKVTLFSQLFRVLGWSALATWLPCGALATAFAAHRHWKSTRMP